jgi:large subunit ribosomal protein L3
MNKAIVGKKLGMSQIFAQDGTVVPVTVVEAGPCPVVHIKTVEKDGYSAAQVAFSTAKKLNKPEAGHFKKANVQPMRYLKELKLDCSAMEVGKTVLTCEIFAEGDKVDVSGTTRGRGFTGTIQRWNTHRGPMAHGSGYHRGVGSLSAHSDPSRVFKNKKMPGQYGGEAVTIQNLQIAKVDAERNLLLIKGAIPGPKGSLVIVKETVK